MSKATTVRAIYKCVLRDAVELQRTPHYCLRNALKLEEWGSGQYKQTLEKHAQTQELPFRPVLTTVSSLKEAEEIRDNGSFAERHVDVVKSVKQTFRRNSGLTEPQVISEKIDEAILALQELSDQRLLSKCSSVTRTQGLRIEATSQYVASHSVPSQNIYRFTYRVTITNENENDLVQIVGRQYTFQSVKGQRIALPRNSPGVVGHKPVLAPGQTFEYASGVDIDAPVGSVTGCLHAIRKSNDPAHEESLFDAFVSKFALSSQQQ